MCDSGLPVLIHDEEQSLRLHCQQEASADKAGEQRQGSCKEPVPSHLMRARSSQAKTEMQKGFGRLRPALGSCLQHAAQRLHGRLRGLAVGDEDQRGGKERSDLKRPKAPPPRHGPPSQPRQPRQPRHPRIEGRPSRWNGSWTWHCYRPRNQE